MFKVNSKHTRKTFYGIFGSLWDIFYVFFFVSAVDFEQNTIKCLLGPTLST